MKGIACICFLFGCGGFGFFKINDYRRHYRELVYIKYILNTMIIEMENHRGTFGETCFVLSQKVKKPYNEIFEGLYHLLEEERSNTPERYWNEKMDILSKELELLREEKEILQGIIRCADSNTLSIPLEVLRQSLVEWDKVILSAEKIKNERSKVTLALSITAGLILCITVL